MKMNRSLVTLSVVFALGFSRAFELKAQIVEPGTAQSPAPETRKSVTLETFLSIKYAKTNETFQIPKDPLPMDEIHHIHTRTTFSLDNDKPKFEQQNYLESAVVYLLAANGDHKAIHILVDMKPEMSIQYVIVLIEGEDTAKVYDPRGNFDEAHLKEKISIHLKELAAKDPRSKI